jgi:hypothetical protein
MLAAEMGLAVSELVYSLAEQAVRTRFPEAFRCEKPAPHD